MSGPKNILIFYNNFTQNQGYFDPAKLTFNSCKTQDLLSSTIKKEYDAILLDLDWLELQGETDEKVILKNLSAANIPLIAIALGDTPPIHNKALSIGACGLIPKEELDASTAQETILDLVGYYSKPHSITPMYVKPSNLISEVITLYLQHSKTCYRHWTDFFGKAATDIFEPDALNALQHCRLSNLEGILRRAIWSAHSDKALKISVKHLGQRFQSDIDNIREMELELRWELERFLEKTNERFRQYGLGSGRRKYPDLSTTKAMLCDIHKKYPQLLVKNKFNDIFNAFSLNITLVYDKVASGDEGIMFKNSYLNSLTTRFNLNISDTSNLAIGSTMPNEINEIIAQTDIFIILICHGLLANPEILDKISGRTEIGSSQVVPILLKHCVWEIYPGLQGLDILPRNEKPVIRDNKDKNKAYKEVMETIWGLVEKSFWLA